MAALLSLAIPLMAPVAVQAQLASSYYCFNTNLGVGHPISSGDGTALALMLSSQGLWTSGTPITTYTDAVASAVSGFQEKYASQILTPNGLTYGTGYIGASTRAELNVLAGCSSSSTTTYPTTGTGSHSTQCPAGFTCTPINTTPTTFVCPTGYTCSSLTNSTSNPSPITPAVPTTPTIPTTVTCPVNWTCSASSGSQNISAPTITSISPTSAPLGGMIVVNGSGFVSPSTALVFNGNGTSQQVSPNSISSNGTVINAYVPSDLSAGTYTVSAENIGSGWTAVSANSVSLTICPTGYTCSTGTTPTLTPPLTPPFTCPTGYTCSTGPVSTPPTTTTCPAGYTCTSTPGTSQNGNCPAGWTCSTNPLPVTTLVTSCPTGYTCSTTPTIICPAGYTCSSAPGTPQNGNCPAGFTCSIPVTTNPPQTGTSCPVGFICSTASTTNH